MQCQHGRSDNLVLPGGADYRSVGCRTSQRSQPILAKALSHLRAFSYAGGGSGGRGFLRRTKSAPKG